MVIQRSASAGIAEAHLVVLVEAAAFPAVLVEAAAFLMMLVETATFPAVLVGAAAFLMMLVALLLSAMSYDSRQDLAATQVVLLAEQLNLLGEPGLVCASRCRHETVDTVLQ